MQLIAILRVPISMYTKAFGMQIFEQFSLDRLKETKPQPAIYLLRVSHHLGGIIRQPLALDPSFHPQRYYLSEDNALGIIGL